ncbi:hypothetical protein Q7C36_019126 [Tachysurus vachellii]|uniref:Uncharacterized protein n=1 Tax=Tachysurus vachellii TaxID=175792 RepID=A0AA88LVR8_TACVA|nr:hypothetical protein Q7C36_019126 [Tachysurus vachellii]
MYPLLLDAPSTASTKALPVVFLWSYRKKEGLIKQLEVQKSKASRNGQEALLDKVEYLLKLQALTPPTVLKTGTT